MIFPPPATNEAADPQGEPLIVPLAIPAIAGPSALATVMLLVSQALERRWEWIAALSVIMALCAIVLLLAERFIIAVERLIGLILVAVSVEMLLAGSRNLHRNYHLVRLPLGKWGSICFYGVMLVLNFLLKQISDLKRTNSREIWSSIQKLTC